MPYKLLVGNVIDKLTEIEPESVQLIVSSPPYYRMRKYGCDFVWGGDKNCDHDWNISDVVLLTGGNGTKSSKQVSNQGTQMDRIVGKQAVCRVCGAWRGELGWEESPELYVSHLCDVFDLARVALKDDGVCFVNLGDTFAGSQKGYAGNGKWTYRDWEQIGKAHG